MHVDLTNWQILPSLSEENLPLPPEAKVWASATSMRSQNLAEDVSFHMKHYLLDQYQNWSFKRPLSLIGSFWTPPRLLNRPKSPHRLGLSYLTVNTPNKFWPHCVLDKNTEILIYHISFNNVPPLIVSPYLKKRIQGRKWRVGRVGNCPPIIWKNRRRRDGSGVPHYYLPTQLSEATYAPVSNVISAL